METKEYKLTDVCDFQGGTQPPKEEWITEPRDGYIRMLQIRDFTQDKAEHVGYVKDTKKLNKCEEDDILIGRYGASVGKILTGLAGAYNVAIIKTIPKEEVLSKRYLYYVLTGTDFQNFILNIGARAAQAGFNKNDLSLFKLHIPTSLNDQEKIANVLEKAKNALNRRVETIVLLDKLIKNTFHKLFGTPSINPNDFDEGNISDVVTEVKYGTSKPAESEGEYVYLRMNNITTEGYWDFESLKYINVEEKDLEKYLVRKGDLVFNRTNSKELVGKTAVFDEENEMIIAGYLIRVRFNEKANPYYVWGYLNSTHGKATLFALCRNIVGMANINAQELQNIKILIPPIEIQNSFETTVRGILRIKNHFLLHQKQLENLLSSLSHKALKGELGLIEKVVLEGTIKVQPKISGEVVVIDKINKELEEFHNSQPHTGAPDEIDNTIRQLEAELKIKGEIPFWDEYVKYRIVKGKFKEAFTFDQLWEEITKFPFETVPEYDEVASLLFKWLSEENAFIRQQFNESTKQIELVLNETAKA